MQKKYQPMLRTKSSTLINILFSKKKYWKEPKHVNYLPVVILVDKFSIKRSLVQYVRRQNGNKHDQLFFVSLLIVGCLHLGQQKLRKPNLN